MTDISMIEPNAQQGEPAPLSSQASQGPLRRALWRMRRDRVTMAAAIWLAFIGAIALLSLVWTPHPANEQFIADPLAHFGNKAWLGTDDLGRDIASRMMVGAAVSLRVSLLVVGIAMLVAVPLGLLSGYKAGWIDTVIMRVLDAITSVPGIVSAMAIVGVLGPGLTNVMIALTIINIPNFVRLVRAQTLAVSAEPYVAASRSVGSRTPWIMFFRVLPGVIPALSVQASLGLGGTLTAEAALSFLGLGVIAPNASWGGMLQRAYQNVLRSPFGLIVPVLVIASVVLAFNLLGDGLRDALGAGHARGSRKKAKLGITSVRLATPSVAASKTGVTDNRLDVIDLTVLFDTERGRLRALDRVSLAVAPGEILGIVGESGSGKTVTAMSIMRLLQSPPGLITGGQVLLDGTDLLQLSMDEMRAVRGNEIAMVFQNPMSSLDPVFTVGNSMRESIRNSQNLSKKAADDRAVELLDLVGIPAPRARLHDYPHNFSGGMRQRVMIAMALAGQPKLLIADEPTTALDVTIQAQILDLIVRLRDEFAMSVILVTHDLGVVAEICDRVSVMYAGQVVETAPVHDLFASPVHPYTAGLLAAVPSTQGGRRRLASMPGRVPQLYAMPDGCRFAPRCPHANDACRAAVPAMHIVRAHEVRCIRADELMLAGR